MLETWNCEGIFEFPPVGWNMAKKTLFDHLEKITRLMTFDSRSIHIHNYIRPHHQYNSTIKAPPTSAESVLFWNSFTIQGFLPNDMIAASNQILHRFSMLNCFNFLDSFCSEDAYTGFYRICTSILVYIGRYFPFQWKEILRFGK